MRYDTVRDLLKHDLGELLDAFSRYGEVLRASSGASRTSQLTDLLEQRLKTIESHQAILMDMATEMDVSPEAFTNQVMVRFTESIQEITAGEGNPQVRDAALLGTIQQIEHDLLATVTQTRDYASSLKMSTMYKHLEQLLATTKKTMHELERVARGSIFIPGLAKTAPH